MDKKLFKINLKRDKKFRMIYSTKGNKHYVITEGNLRKYEFYHNRYIFSFTLMLLISIMNIYVALAAAVVSFVVLEYLFRNVFLDKCKTLDNFLPHPDDKPFKRPKSSYILLGLLYLLLGATLIVYTFIEDTNNQILFISIGISGFAVFSGIRSLLKFFNYDNN